MLESSNPAPRPSVGLVGRITGALPTLLVLGTLAGLAVWGHHTGWKVPGFGTSKGTAADRGDWCEAHNVPEAECVECRPELLPRGKEHGFCKKHGVAECPWCFPDVAQLPSPPAITPADLARVEQARQFAERPANDGKCKKHLRRLQFASESAAERAGVQDPVPATLAPVVEAVAGSGEIGYDPTHVAHLSSRVPGTVWRVEKKVGDSVHAGEVVAVVDAAEVGKVKADFLQAFALVELKNRTLESMRGAGPSLPIRTLQEAEGALREARVRLLGARQALVNLGLPVRDEEIKGLTDEQLAARLQFLGLPEEVSRSLDSRTTSANLLPVRAPLDGVVVSRDVVAGEVVDTTKVLLTIADVRKMWLTLNLRLEDARRVREGQDVHFRPDGEVPATLPWYGVSGDKLAWKRTVDGKVNWISTAVDEKTRTVKVRAEVANLKGQLRAGTFGTGRIVLREEAAVVVPKDAVQWEGCCHVVFVQDKNYHAEGAPKVFHVRKVLPGAADDTRTEIIAGVLPGEVVVTRGAGVLRAELLKNDLGDG